MTPAAIPGLGYVPVRSPPATPLGARESLRRASLPGAACKAPVPSVRIDGVPTTPSLLAALTIVSSIFNRPIVGFGYEPARSPPATPLGALESDSLESLPAAAVVAVVPSALSASTAAAGPPL